MHCIESGTDNKQNRMTDGCTGWGIGGLTSQLGVEFGARKIVDNSRELTDCRYDGINNVHAVA